MPSAVPHEKIHPKLRTSPSHNGMGQYHSCWPLTKSGQRLQNVPETVTITDPLVLAYVWAVIPRLQAGERLFHHQRTSISRGISRFGTVGSPSSIQVASIFFETRWSHSALTWNLAILIGTMVRGRWGFNQNHAVVCELYCGISCRDNTLPATGHRSLGPESQAPTVRCRQVVT